PYHGGLELEQKNTNMQLWLRNACQVIVATNAFGMGIDKPDVQTVIHYHLPESLENYYQEAGRAGRNGQLAQSIIIKSRSDIDLVRKQYLSILPSKEDIKHLYKNLNNYFQIPYGEGLEEEFNFNFAEFCNHYRLNALKTYQALLFLERQSVLRLNRQFRKKTAITFLIESNRLLHHIEKNQEQSILVKTILRIYGGSAEQKISLDLNFIASKTGLKNEKIITILQSLERDQIATVSIQNTDARITFLVPREDQYTINQISKYLVQQNEVKHRLVEKLIEYTEQNEYCLQHFILSYFGETDLENCNNCSYCFEEKKKNSTIDWLHYKTEIEKLLLNSSMSSTQLIHQLNFDKEIALEVIKQMLDNDLIILNNKNQFELVT
ncbi:MAG: C-terminal helicase domain-containing protein, partial [Flavobacteriaceae bacterium]|nr:C-terminal helicase domain-containing protein [Flavobacteriaceae bacterium]